LRDFRLVALWPPNVWVRSCNLGVYVGRYRYHCNLAAGHAWAPRSIFCLGRENAIILTGGFLFIPTARMKIYIALLYIYIYIYTSCVCVVHALLYRIRKREKGGGRGPSSNTESGDFSQESRKDKVILYARRCAEPWGGEGRKDERRVVLGGKNVGDDQ
jgi:hypothetical protein